MKLLPSAHIAFLSIAIITVSCCHCFLVKPSLLFLRSNNNVKPQQDDWCSAGAAMVHFEHVYYQHTVHNNNNNNSWMRRLFSSEPYRIWALEDVTFHWESELVLLVGASSSGKSTALHLMMSTSSTAAATSSQRELPQIAPTHGSVHVSTLPIYVDTTKLSIATGCRRMRHWTVRRRLAPRPMLLQAMSLLSCADKTIEQLSLSEQYKLLLAELCITGHNNTVEDLSPILLLDEWLDNEPTSIVTAVEDALETFVATTKGVVCVVTHKKERWKTQNHMELRQGKVVRRTYHTTT